MKEIIFSIFIIFLFTCCKKEPAQLLAQRWSFTALDVPGMKTFLLNVGAEEDSDDITMQKFLLGNKLILRKDSTFDMVILRQYIHGNWSYDEASRNLFLKDESASRFDLAVRVDSISPYHLRFDIDEFTLNKLIYRHSNNSNGYNYLLNKSYCEFFLDADKDRYTKLSEDPYSRENNWWRMKPAKPETDEQLKQRVLNHLAFWQLLFIDANEKNRSYFFYSWFASPLVVAGNGVILKFYNDSKKEWDQNFYDSAQAHKGYEIMRKCFSKKINYMQTEDKYKRNEDIIKQLIDNLLTATASKPQ